MKINEERHIDLVTRLRKAHRAKALSSHSDEADRMYTPPAEAKKQSAKKVVADDKKKKIGENEEMLGKVEKIEYLAEAYDLSDSDLAELDAMSEADLDSYITNLIVEELESLDDETRELTLKYFELIEAEVPEDKFDELLGEGWRAHLGDAAAGVLALGSLAGGLYASHKDPSGMAGVPITIAGGAAASAIQNATHKWDMNSRTKPKGSVQQFIRNLGKGKGPIPPMKKGRPDVMQNHFKGPTNEETEINEGKRWNRFKKAWKNTDTDADIDSIYHTIDGMPIVKKSFPGFMLSSLKHPNGKVMAGLGAVSMGHLGVGAGLVGAGAAQKAYRVAKEYRRLKKLGEDVSDLENELMTIYELSEEDLKDIVEMPDETMEDIEAELTENETGEEEAEDVLTPGDYIVAAAMDGKPADVAEIFAAAIKERAAEILDDYKADIAASMFEAPEAEESEEEDVQEGLGTFLRRNSPGRRARAANQTMASLHGASMASNLNTGFNHGANKEAIQDHLLNRMRSLRLRHDRITKKMPNTYMTGRRSSTFHPNGIKEDVEPLDEARKEHEAATKAFLSGGKFKSKRRSVENGVYKLHGNTIAYHKDGKVHATLAGWPTVTTRGSLNHLAKTMGAPGFSQKGGKQYHGDHVINANDHVPLNPRMNDPK